jgi:hypothetical protein
LHAEQRYGDDRLAIVLGRRRSTDLSILVIRRIVLVAGEVAEEVRFYSNKLFEMKGRLLYIPRSPRLASGDYERLATTSQTHIVRNRIL